MKEIKAFVKPSRVQKVVEALQENGFESVTLSQGEGTGAYNRKDAFPSLDFRFTDSKIVKVELVCQNEEAEKAVQLISENGRSPEPGDGIIYMTEIESAYRIKTGESMKRFDF
ncbi:P-II family nitrogen regulator [Pontibacter sp. 172403-2]|uniref:P-II family nitrogen regulator n=1 Tax=Pontibacter rufus TaxID=2791028 RepID=UPI0018B00681|nr:P-II family nitrogen regulator [Pontibacter sp. 172403-2]MBF9252221.1 P-II family nitrogen regulator [Pontibacter sp. 172403-2]